MQIRAAPAAIAATQAVSEFDRWEALAASRDEVGGEENASVLAAAAHGYELYLPSRKFPQCTAQAGIEGVAIAGTHLVRKLHADDLVAARKLLGPEAGVRGIRRCLQAALEGCS